MDQVLLILGNIGLIIFTALLMYIFYKYCFVPYQILKKCGIKGPFPVPIVGNLLIFKMNLAEISKYLYDEYDGPVVGIFFGRKLTVYAKDPEMIKQITNIKFECFIDRPSKVRTVRDEYKIGGLASATGETWKNTRKILTPAFSTSKLKMMTPLIKRSVDILVERLGEIANSQQSVNLLELYSTFTLESIIATSFGRVIDVQRGKANELTKALSKAADMKRDRLMYICARLLMVMPCLKNLVQLLFLRRNHSSSWNIMQEVSSRLIDARKAELQKSKTYKDILQFMIEASNDDTSVNDIVEASVVNQCPMNESDRSTKLRLSSKEVLDNSIMLLSDETSKNNLAHISYLLAIHPDIQMELQSEIDSFIKENPDATLYEAAQKIHYLDYTIQESLRIYPPSVTISRLCVNSTTIGNVRIPKGTQVHIPIKELHYDPKYWDNPEKFIPNRFSAKKKVKRPNNVHLPFGVGPRNCIGMRFALLEAKILLIEVLQQFSFVQGPNTKVPLPAPDGFSATPTEGIFVKVVHRN